MNKKEYVLYGLDNHKKVIDDIITTLDTPNDDFDVRLILTEALTNAFKHGNDNRVDKPIYIRTTYDEKSVNFEIEDCGRGFFNKPVVEEILEENVLDSYGRGLFLIKAISDKLELRKNVLIIQKNINKLEPVFSI
ncbi:MAG: ATP-binding protein [Maledivibacter sp.]|jgi:serine/threonine-protein kinase RsbW|nr:ATP-binding protein [Maledivibacter sp.]